MNCLTERRVVIIKFIAQSDAIVFLICFTTALIVIGMLFLIYLMNVSYFGNERIGGTYFIGELGICMMIVIMSAFIYTSCIKVKQKIIMYDNQKLELALLTGLNHANYNAISV